MNISDLKNKKIGIFGFGTEGEALLDYFKKHKIKNVTVFDESDLSKQKKQKIYASDAILVGGTFDKENSSNIEIAFRSPGLKIEKIKDVLNTRCIVSSQTNLFFALHKGKIVAVTGTKGKSTTVGLVSRILELGKFHYYVGGNIGNPPISFVDDTTGDSVSVLELSSFQLEDLEFAPDIAIILPLYIDHLDYHESQGQSFNFHENQRDYYEAKAQIVKNMDKNGLIVAHCGENVRKIINSSLAKKIFFCQKQIGNGCFLEGSNVGCETKQGRLRYENVEGFCKEAKIPIVNALAALTYAFSQKIDFRLEDLFRDFKKLPFRIELVLNAQELSFYNDSASTNPVSAIEAMRTMSQKYVLIMGGSSKNLSFDNLAQAASRDENIAKIYLIGQTASEIEDELKLAGFNAQIIRKDDLEQVMREIKSDHRSFTCVLFSPASASFDKYENYKQRGEYFNKFAKDIFR